MKLKFNEFEIDILPFVQLCGMNCKKKEFIINSIEKHFSSGKYKDYEKEYQECFLVDGQILGRNYFKNLFDTKQRGYYSLYSNKQK